jgi:glycosyltransferase involved in cell wall biosynthesis
VHGAAEVTRWIAQKLEPITRVEKLSISPAEGCRGLGYHLSRITRVASAACALISGKGPVYLSAAGGFGLGYNVLLAAVAHLVARPIFIHHHSFAYLDRADWLAVLLVRSAGASAVHICLCSRMAALLVERYGPLRTVIVSNAAYCRLMDGSRTANIQRTIRIGHLGNLSSEKGLDIVIALTELLIQRGIAVQLMLAGPTVDSRGAMMLQGARERLGSNFKEFGALYGNEKEQFFNSIDFFIFPSRYVNEAEPLVVFEALAHGVPVIAFNRGCIAEQVGAAGLMIDICDDFVEFAASRIAEWSTDAASYGAIRIRAYEQFRNLRSWSEHQVDDLLAQLKTASI